MTEPGTTEPSAIKRLWRDYSLTVVSATLFVLVFAGWAIVEWLDYSSEVERHGKSTDFGGFITRFGAYTLENWQSEFLHVLLIVLLTAFFVHKGSAESRDNEDRMEAALERIEKRLDSLEGRGGNGT